MKLIALILNIPWSIILLLASQLSKPLKVEIDKTSFSIIIYVRSFWWYSWVPAQKGVRGMTLGNVILLGPKLLPKDLEHELIHIEQHQREPFVHPILNGLETLRHGYRQNKYEDEAYTRAGNRYVGHAI